MDPKFVKDADRSPLIERVTRKSVFDLTSRANITAIGRPRGFFMDTYVQLMGMRWSQLILLFIVGFLSFNFFFAFLYWVMPGSLTNAATNEADPSFWDSFFFSVQTVATIGYGVLSPRTMTANVLVTGEIIFGVLGFAMGNGLMFARFSRATSRIMFSKIAVIAPYNGMPMLMFRAANQRHNLIMEAHVRVAMLRNETSAEGKTMRRFRDLGIERRDNLTFVLSWTVMHAVDELSPFFGMSPEAIAASDMEIIVIMTGTDESFSQPVYARHSYRGSDIVVGKHFADIIGVAEDGRRTIDYTKFHDLEM